MQAILPGRPQAKPHALDYGQWEGQLVVTYVSGNALLALNGPRSLLQTIYHDDVGPSGFQAVAYNRADGKIAAASDTHVYVYRLREAIKGTLRWTLDLTLRLPAKDDTIRTLSWGSDEDLLVGSTSLTLFSTHIPSRPSSPAVPQPSTLSPKPSWSKPIASPVSYAAFSPTASLIATTSPYDCLVKVWRRLSFESPTFDYAYLRHPDVVTHLEWRRDGDGEGSAGNEDEVLYTICADGKFRVWRVCDSLSMEILCLHAEIDMVSAIQPRDPKDTAISRRRYAFTLDAGTLSQAISEMSKNGKGTAGQDKHALEYAKEIASRRPDIVVFLDEHGHMSAWGLENVGCKKRNSSSQHAQPFHVAHVEGLSFGFQRGLDGEGANSRLLSLIDPESPGQIVVLAHHFDGRIQWWQGAVQDLFDPSSKKDRIRDIAAWTGHSDAIKKINRTASGKALFSRTEGNEGIVWSQVGSTDGQSLRRRSVVALQEHIHRTVLLREGSFLALLHHDSISLWDTRKGTACEVARCKYSLQGKQLCLLVLPETEAHTGLVHIATISSEQQGIVWELVLPNVGQSYPEAGTNSDQKANIKQFCTFTLSRMEGLKYILPVDPAGSSPVISGFLDSFAQDVAVSYTATGLVRTWTAKINQSESSVDWLTTGSVETSVQNPSLGSATSIRKAALVDERGTTLTIWDTRSGSLDHNEEFPDQHIQDLDWASTPDNQSILAVGFSHRVLVYSQLRYDYVSERPAWTRVKDVSIRELTPHPIGDSVWLGNGSLVIGAGNQLFMASRAVNLETDLAPELQSSIPHKRAQHIYELVYRMNGPLPVFHPQFISQCVLAGKIDVVHRILVALYRTLKFYTEGEDLDALQGLTVEDFLDGIEPSAERRNNINGHSYSSHDADDEPTNVTEDLAQSLTTLLTQKSIPQLTSSDQFSLADVTGCVATLEKHQRSIDINAARFLLFWREAIIHSHHSEKSRSKASQAAAVSWREIVWAYHSSSQDILVDLITRQHRGRLEWSHARDAGMFMWLTDRQALLAQFEVIARSAYSSTDPKNPVDCSLHYLALRKKPVLLGLWRMATWSREQAATMRLMKNDFTDPRWKTAAAKNAYALMGKRRFEYAAAFFLLADDLHSAVSVLSNQLDDMQLAIAVARVYGGDDCLALKNLLEKKVLPLAATECNRWQSTWCYWFLGQRSHAVRALVSPLHTLLSPPGTPPATIQAKSFLNDDPALVILYRQLREKSLQTLKGAMMITGAEEWAFVTKTASLLRRMGCDVLALDLVRNWEFLKPQLPVKRVEDESEEENETVAELADHKEVKSALDGFDVDPRKLLRRRSSLVVADMPQVVSQKPRTPATQPVASLLDDYGFGGDSNVQKQPVKQSVPSMLDDYAFGGDPAAQQKSSAKQSVPSMLDGYGFGDSGMTSGKTGKSNGEADADGKTAKPVVEKKPAPTVFKEPDPNSLLDSFGF